MENATPTPGVPDDKLEELQQQLTNYRKESSHRAAKHRAWGADIEVKLAAAVQFAREEAQSVLKALTGKLQQEQQDRQHDVVLLRRSVQDLLDKDAEVSLAVLQGEQREADILSLRTDLDTLSLMVQNMCTEKAEVKAFRSPEDSGVADDAISDLSIFSETCGTPSLGHLQEISRHKESDPEATYVRNGSGRSTPASSCLVKRKVPRGRRHRCWRTCPQCATQSRAVKVPAQSLSSSFDFADSYQSRQYQSYQPRSSDVHELVAKIEAACSA